MLVITGAIGVHRERARAGRFDRSLCDGSVHARATHGPRARVDLHAVEQRFERRVVDFDVTRALGGRGQDEGAAIEPLVELTHSAAVEEQNLQRVTATTEEQKERAAARVVADVFLGKARQPIERVAHVDRLERDEDLDALRDHARSPSARTTCRSTSGSKPARTDTRAAPTATTMAASVGGGTRTTRAIRTCGSRFFRRSVPVRRQLAQYTSVDGLKSRLAANSFAVWPLACQFAGSWGHPFAGSWGQGDGANNRSEGASDRPSRPRVRDRVPEGGAGETFA